MKQKVPEQKLRELLSKIFEVPLNAISENASPDTIETWDSLRHMNLVVALEQAFNVELSDDQVVEILSYKLIKIVLQERGVEFT
ncbi:MAG: acyl carrier protein [Ignavibacteriales bacterium]|nr:acyl carrier protein [Ignavibacteriales bacterium]